MNIAIICFTMNGFVLAEKAETILTRAGHAPMVYTKSRNLRDVAAVSVKESLKLWTKKMYETMDAILFIGASGIAVRAISSCVEDKKHDPAILVLDEQGQFCISLMAGSRGTANELTKRVCSGLNATPVLSSATEENAAFAVDVFAKKNHLHISNMSLAKSISEKLLAGEKIGFISELPVEGTLPEGLSMHQEGAEFGIYVGIHYDRQPFEQTLWLIPRSISAGIVCGPGADEEDIEEMFEEACQINLIFHEAVTQIATTDSLKQDERLKDFCDEVEISLTAYRTDELDEAEGEICEQCALKASSDGIVIQKKIEKKDVSIALVFEEWSIDFD